MKLVWKQVTLGALLLLGSVAAMEKGGGDIGSSDGVSHLDCDDVDDVGSQHPLMNHQPSFLDAIKYFFGLDEEVKMTADNDRTDLKTKGVDSLPRRLGNIFKRPPFPPTPEVARDRPTPSTDPKEEVPVVGGKKVHKHYWPLPTDVEIGKQFEARVLVGFVGNPYALSDEEKRELADAFTVTYNDLNEREGFIITSATFIDALSSIDSSASQRRRLQDSVTGSLNFNELLRIDGKCGDDCGDILRVFADDVQGRQLAVPSVTPHHYLRDSSFHRRTQETCVGCPTIEKFVTSYADAIASLQTDGRLVNVANLDRTIVEQERVECPSDNLTDFESVVDVTFNLTAEPSDVELEVLGRSFVESYNQENALNGETCDLSFRVVESAVASKADNATVNSRNRKLGNGANEVYTLIFNGKCKDCKSKSKSTCDGCSRRALHSGNTIQNDERPEWMLGDAGLPYRNRGLQDTAIQCYCPIGNPEERLPSIEELLAAYDDNVQFLANEGALTSVSSVVDIVEESQTNKECDSDDDCDDDQQCIANICVTLGIPTFRLIWTGDDDLDLHVLTPAAHEISWINREADSGVLDQDDIPYEERDWVENVFFPSDGSAPPGTYTYWVVQFGQTGAADPWELQVLDRETVIQSERGTVEDLTAEDFLNPPESTRYTFEYNP